MFNPELLIGTWEGKLEVGVIQLRTVFNIKKEEGKITATVDSPDQGAFGIPVSEVIPGEGKKFTLKIQSVAATYEGEMETAEFIKGQWLQSNQTFPLDMKKLPAPIDYSRPQDPQKPYPYMEKEVTFKNIKAGITLAGTFTYPENSAAMTAVILISGSGSQNRNEEIMGHRPFLVLADHLSRKGIAVLRYDDRGVGGSGGNPATASSEDYAADVEAAINYLKSQEWIKIARIGLIGHSEGGMIAPMVAVNSPDVAFIVLLAGPGCTGKDILIQQTEAILSARGTPEQQIRSSLTTNSEIYDLLINAKDMEMAKKQIEDIMYALGMKVDQVKQQIAVLTSPWYLYFLKYDPVPVLERLQIPVLALNGSLDLQVLAGPNLEAIKKALETAGNLPYSVIKEFKGLNHLFQTAQTGLMDEYNTIQETIAPEVLDFISTWIKKIEAY